MMRDVLYLASLVLLCSAAGCSCQPDLTEEQKRGLEVLARIANPDPLLERQAKAHNDLSGQMMELEGANWQELYAAKQQLEKQYQQRTQAGVTAEAVEWYEAESQRLKDRIASMQAQK